MTTIVNSRAISVSGLMRGMNVTARTTGGPCATQRVRVRHAGQERDPEIDEDALGDLADGDVDRGAVQAELSRAGPWSRTTQAKRLVEEHLEDGVEGHKPGRVFGVAASASWFQTIHHGDAARAGRS